ncbi:hypothetical protein XO10_07790 [Marinitoga sp. 1135]|uniref:Uncharacterized protein n=1 Tax=Marinitoga piezophila (strain DSM 14283 / JCM 11233 / KA3) TaxID=443254 RepID=H2J4M8_MARPK|nr:MULTISPECIES: hypothetical protein [Marinitoga]AEX85970.1 hypothetical protein Marpi_1580 [Marinitoga piezophila KA3]NUU96164.1 hypothetical protein [Marinitoga sp. 1135]NUU98072.1 hypothetical protein [Marinitoga sp. 1138]
MKKNILISLLLLLFITSFSINYEITNNYLELKIPFWSTKNQNLGISGKYPFSYDLHFPTLGTYYTGSKEFYTYQKIFFKKIKLKIGERIFDFGIKYDIENNSPEIFYSIKKYSNQLAMKSFSYSYNSVFKNGSETRNLSSSNILAATILKLTTYSNSFKYKNTDFSVSNYSVYAQRYMKIPFILGESSLGISLSLPVGILENKYFSGFWGYGVLYSENNYYPYFTFQSPFKIDKSEYYIGMQMKMSEDAGFLLYLSKNDIKNPLSIIITNNGWCFFIEY